MKIAIMCDMHLPENYNSIQYDYFNYALEDINKNNPDFVIVAGDITAYGQTEASNYYIQKMSKLKNVITVLGNSDVRSKNEVLLNYAKGGLIDAGRKILCINTPYGYITKQDFEKIENLNDGDVFVMHHYVKRGLNSQTKEKLNEILNRKSLIVICGHIHSFDDLYVGKSRVISLRALDAEKTIGAPPCITYFNITKDEFSYGEKIFSIPKENLNGFRDLIGISCFDVTSTFDYAIKADIKNIELRKYSEDDGLFDLTIEKVKKWREKCGNVLSMHMPDVTYEDGKINYAKWAYALKLAKATGVLSMTVHPPRVSVKFMNEHMDEFVDLYFEIFSSLSKDIKIGFENMHMRPNIEGDDENRGYGYIPSEIIALINAVNEKFGYERVGAVLDMGHARNNPPYHSIYPIGTWHVLIGKKIVAYHIHQCERDEDLKLKNHRAIKNWHGPMISYSGFFKAWEKNIINRSPMFLELRKLEEAVESIEAFDNLKEF